MLERKSAKCISKTSAQQNMGNNRGFASVQAETALNQAKPHFRGKINNVIESNEDNI